MSEARDPSRRWICFFIYNLPTVVPEEISFDICTLSKMWVASCFCPFNNAFWFHLMTLKWDQKRVTVPIFPERLYFWNKPNLFAAVFDHNLSVVFHFLPEHLQNILKKSHHEHSFVLNPFSPFLQFIANTDSWTCEMIDYNLVSRAI